MATSLSWAHISAPAKEGGRRRLVVFASKFAGCAGMHQYMNPDEMKFEFIHAICGPGAAEDILPDGYVPPKEFEKQTMERGMTAEAKRTLEDAVDSIKQSENSEQSTKTVAEAVKKINAMPGVSAAAKELARRDLFTQHGVHGEESIRKDASNQHGAEIRADNKFRTSALLAQLPDGFDLYVGGRHDGIMQPTSDDDDAGPILTEIKNRTRRHMGVPLYERVQLHCYMSIFNVNRGLLIENYRKEAKEHPVFFDQTFWDGVVETAAVFLTTCILECRKANESGHSIVEESAIEEASAPPSREETAAPPSREETAAA